MFRKIIVATDLSDASFEIVKCLGDLKDYGAEECLLLQCLNMQELASVAFSYTTTYIETTMTKQKDILEKQGFTVQTRTVAGSAGSEINRIAEEENFSLIVIGSRGHSKARDYSLGSVASEVLHHARKPVLLARINVVTETGEQRLKVFCPEFGKHILFPTDFSENADRAFTYVEKLVADGAKKITLLHVQDKNKMEPHLVSRIDEFNEIDRARLEELKKRLAKKGKAEVKVDIRYGKPFIEINSVLDECGANLVVMGFQGRGRVSELFIGSVSHNIARHAAASVLLVPAD